MSEQKDDLRESIKRRHDRLRQLADPECRICHGRGLSANWVAQGYAYHACTCTGAAAWQNPDLAETPLDPDECLIEKCRKCGNARVAKKGSQAHIERLCIQCAAFLRVEAFDA